ncbi:hypothetical protein FFLO_02266 [Filobasidium floriforme]|uniref:Uncharacterized protein n=1 Tax=Filobasidium floriforme TaxID=5210 RepID=A0A8K0NP93_9TREE|nr:hypothetical protein FFLO_02266 [Filobasidium floriforme]
MTTVTSPSRRNAGFRKQLFTLMFIRTVEPLSICQLFAYVNPMTEYLLPSTDKADIGRYSGAIESAFAIGSFLFAFQWGRLSDRIGRRPAILMGMMGIALSVLAFGLSRNFYFSLVARFLGGALCGNASVIRATLGEITPPEAEHWVYPLYTVIWDVSVIVGPILGATLADPARQYPGTWFGNIKLFQDHPFLPPCALIAAMAMAAAAATLFVLEESLEKHESLQGGDGQETPASENTALLSTPRRRPASISTTQLLSYPAVQQVLAAFFLMAIISMGFDALFVLFCYSPKDIYGIEIKPSGIAQAFAFKGFFSIAFAACILPLLQRRLGVLKLYNALNPFWAVSFALPLVMNVLARQEHGWVVDGEMRKMWALMIPLMITYTLGDLAWASLSVIANNSAPVKGCLGALNGIAISCSSLGRAVGPAFGGLLYSLSARSHIPIVWIVFIGLSALTSIQGWTLQPTARALSDDEEGKDERPESGSAGYGALETTGGTVRKPVFTVVEAKTRAEWLECVGIRIEVFIDEQGYDMADEVDKYDEKDVSVHFCLYAQDDPEKAERGEKGVPAGTVRVVKSSLKLGRLAVSKNYRGYGLGKNLVQAVHDWVKVEGHRGYIGQESASGSGEQRAGRKVTIKLEAQLHAIKFYEKMGYHIVGEEFICDGQPHILMVQDFEVS